MPVLTSPAEIRGHLLPALRDRAHYVFAADSDQGKHLVRTFGIGAVTVFRATGEDVGVAEFDYLVAPAGLSSRLLLLTVRKSAVPPWAIATFLAAKLGHIGPLTPDQDLFPISDDPVRLGAILDAIRRDAFTTAYPAVN